MNAAIDQLAKSITGKNSLSDCSIEELLELSDQYPYFGPVHFLLSQRLKKDDPLQFEKQIQKTSLFFQNSLWLQYLSDNYIIKDIAPPGEIFQETPQVYDEVLPQEKIEEVPEKTVSEHIDVVTEPEKVILPPEVNTEAGTEKTAEIEQQAEIKTVADTEPEPAIQEADNFQNTAEKEQPEAEYQEAEADNFNKEEIADSPVEEKTVGQPEMISELTATGSQENELPDGEAEPEPEEQMGPEVELPPLKIEPVDISSTKLTFEPYHTVDYFASQGVSLNEEEKNKDKFGKQLKSFTEWLKTMKRLPESEIIVPAIVPQDPRVEKMAEHSIAREDVITETMAEIWERQGNHEKAVEIYNKLSLLNPAKSSYFAAKIEHLKHL